MNYLSNSIIFLIIILTFCGCTSSKDSDSANTTAQTPKNADEALAQLSPEHKNNFETWKKSVIKGCYAAEAFGLDSESEMTGIDAAALILKNGNSLVFSDDVSFAIVTPYDSFPGTGETKTSTSNENGTTLFVETKRVGSNCSVYLFGQKVYETIIAKNFIVETEWSTTKQGYLESGWPEINMIGNSDIAEVKNTGISSLISQILKPDGQILTLISNKLGIAEEQTEELFQLSHYASTHSAIRIKDESTAIWSNGSNGNLLAKSNVLRNLFDGENKIIPFEIRLNIPEIAIGDIKNTADIGNLKLVMDVSVSKENRKFTYATDEIKADGFTVFDKNEATKCLEDRFYAYIDVTSSTIKPSVSAMFDSCDVLQREIEQLSFANGLIASLIPHIFSNISPTSSIWYEGWDDVLSRLSLKLLEEGKDIVSTLDPDLKTKIVTIVADNLQTLNNNLNLAKNMSSFKNSVFKMGLSWSFSGYIVSKDKTKQILSALDNSIGTFEESSLELLSELRNNPYSHTEQLDFALNINDSYKKEATKALELSKELDYSKFEQDVFNKVIQNKIPVDVFTTWSNKFMEIKGEVNKYPSLSGIKSELVKSSLNWLESEAITLQELSGIYSVISNAIDPFKESTLELMQSQSFLENTEALNFATALSQEYKKLALAIRDNAVELGHEDWGLSFFNSILQKRPCVNDLKVWNELWSSALAFTQREHIRTKDEFGSTNEWYREEIIETAIKELWSSVEFEQLEQIAELARDKNMSCEIYKGYSSLAHCGGMRLFSKKEGMFFDPSFDNRYVALKQEFAGFMKKLSGFEWLSLKNDLVGSFFGSFKPIWSKCDNKSFNKNSSLLKTQINAIIRETDQFKIWELEDAIDDTLDSCS